MHTTLTPIELAAMMVAVLLNMTRVIEATKAAWGFIPTQYQAIPSAILVAATTLEQKLATGVTSYMDIVVPVVFVLANLAPGLRSASHVATAKVAAYLADGNRAQEHQVVAAQRGKSQAARLVGMTLMLFLLPLGLARCNPAQVAAVESVVAGVANAVAHDTTLLNGLKQDADDFFAVAPNPAIQKAVGLAFDDAREALEALGAAAEGTGDTARHDVKAAAEKFKVAWEKLQDLLQQAHVLQSPGIRSNGAAIPKPLSLRYAS